MRFTKIGMRTIKTVISVILTLIVADILGLKSPILAGIAAIMTIETSLSESFTTGKNRMYGTILGGIIALITTSLAPGNLVFIGIGLIIIINLCNTFKWEKATRMSMVVFLIIVLNYKDGDGLSYAINRTIDTLMGVIIGTTINYIIRPPKIEDKIKLIFNNMNLELKMILENLIWKGQYDSLDNFKKEINNIEKNYKVFLEDKKFQVIKEKDIINYGKLLDSYENIRNHLRVINSIKINPFINEDNKEKVEKYFLKEVVQLNDNSMDDLDIIYNYHLEKIMEELFKIEEVTRNKLNSIS